MYTSVPVYKLLFFFLPHFRSKSWLLPASDLFSVWNGSLTVSALPLQRLWLLWIFESCYFNLTIKMRDWAVFYTIHWFMQNLSHLLSSRRFRVSSYSMWSLKPLNCLRNVLLIRAFWIQDWAGNSFLGYLLAYAVLNFASYKFCCLITFSFPWCDFWKCYFVSGFLPLPGLKKEG